jgi:hypothetical protein
MVELPPQMSGSFYPSGVADESRQNLLSAGLLFTVAYDDNLLTGLEAHPVSAKSYIIEPNIALSTKTSRLSGSLSYVAGFMFYDPTSDLNDVTQNAVASFAYRFTPRARIGVSESFQQNSTVFSEPYLLAGSGISSSPNYVPPETIAPYVGQVADSTGVNFSYQYSQNSLIGFGGNLSSFHYAGNAQAQGLYDSIGGGGSASYSHRLGRTQYLGFSYEYSTSNTSAYDATTKSQYGLVLYSVGLPNRLTLSFSGGPEYTTTTAPGSTPTHNWDPSGNASIGWQKNRANLALSYSRAVTTGWGLYGSYLADGAAVVANWKFSPRLTGAMSGNYSNTKNASTITVGNMATGHTIYGRSSLQYRMGQHLNLVAEYGRLHESIARAAIFAQAPNDDRVSLSLNYVLQKPLGR